MTVETFKMIWPVLDPAKTRNELMQEAVTDLRAQYDALGLRPVSAPNFRFGHGDLRAALAKLGILAECADFQGPMLLATVATVQLPRVPDDWEDTQ